MKKYWWLLVIFAAIGGWMVFAARTPTGEEDLYSILNDIQYNEVLQRVRGKTEDALFAFGEGQALTKMQRDNLADAAGDLRKMIAYQPTNFGPYVILAKSQRALGEVRDAIRNYKQALELMPREPTDQETLVTRAEVVYDLGAYYYEEGDFENAEKYATEAVQLINTNPKYLIGLAAIDAQLAKYANARTLLDLALSLDPDNPVGHELDAELKKAGH